VSLFRPNPSSVAVTGLFQGNIPEFVRGDRRKPRTAGQYSLYTGRGSDRILQSAIPECYRCITLLGYIKVVENTGLFISPSGISGLCCTITKTDTAERSISTDRETLPSVCPTLQVLHISTPGDAADVNPVIQFLPHTLQHPMVDSSDCLHDSLSELW
jgi:hypothetical protein